MLKGPHAEQYVRFREMMIEMRKQAGLTQADIAGNLGKPQSYVSKYENGERRLDVIEFLEIANAIGIDPSTAMKKLGKAIKQN